MTYYQQLLSRQLVEPVDVQVELNSRDNWDVYANQAPARQNADSPAWSVARTPTGRSKNEMKKLAALHSGPDHLIQETMKYARAHQKDPRVPEALHYALCSQSYGCVRKETAALAMDAKAGTSKVHQGMYTLVIHV